ncbi:MAG: (d)CMP kinase [Gemmataceae bacterium]
MIITIDGPAGAGKSSAARALAQRLGFEFLDTGAMYRAVALSALRAGIDPRQEPALAGLVESLRLQMPPGGRVLLDGEDVTPHLRKREVTAATGAVADSPSVRRRLAQMQRAIAQGRDMVCEGRDQGTIVFPDAFCKFFLFADPAERARRRQREMAERGEVVEMEQLLRDQKIRDQRDADRELAPMKPAADAVLLDSTRLSPEQVVDAMEAEFRRRASQNC